MAAVISGMDEMRSEAQDILEALQSACKLVSMPVDLPNIRSHPGQTSLACCLYGVCLPLDVLGAACFLRARVCCCLRS